MSSNSLRAAAVFFVLVAVGVAGRFLFHDTDQFYRPNFTPTVAVALFAGFYFRRMSVAMLVPLTVMAISNLWIESYGSWGVMVTVYLALCFPVLLRGLFRHGGETPVGTGLRIATGVLAPSLVFYLTTNLAVWCFQTYYPPTFAGLVECYYYALPFYRWFLQGDLLFIPMTFGSYAAVRYLAARSETQAEASPALTLSR